MGAAGVAAGVAGAGLAMRAVGGAVAPGGRGAAARRRRPQRRRRDPLRRRVRTGSWRPGRRRAADPVRAVRGAGAGVLGRGIVSSLRSRAAGSPVRRRRGGTLRRPTTRLHRAAFAGQTRWRAPEGAGAAAWRRPPDGGGATAAQGGERRRRHERPPPIAGPKSPRAGAEDLEGLKSMNAFRRPNDRYGELRRPRESPYQRASQEWDRRIGAPVIQAQQLAADGLRRMGRGGPGASAA